MVKILQAYNFARQNTYSLNGDILAATLIGSNRIAISSAGQFIEIYNISDKQRPSEVSSSENDKSDERSPTKYSLPTVGEVVNLIYCEAGRYLLTLEKENLGSPLQSNNTSISCTSSNNGTATYSEDDIKMFVRIYANFWKFSNVKLIDLPITIRIASMTTPKAPLVESIDVIELPLRSPPELIQCCQKSGNIIVSSKDRIYLYEYTQCTHEITQPRFSYIDFLPFKFFVNLSFVPLKLNLAENVIACMNNRFCVAFKVVDVLGSSAGIVSSYPLDNDYDVDETSDDVDEAISSSVSSTASKASAGASSNHSFETDSLETTSSGQIDMTSLPGRTPIDFNVARLVNSACGREFEVDLKSQWEKNGDYLIGSGSSAGVCGSDTQAIFISPTRATEIKIKLVNESKAMNVQRISSHGNTISSYNDDTTVQYDIRKLFQICMKTSEPNSRIVEIFRCMDLKAIYQRNTHLGENMEETDYELGNQQVPSAVTRSKHSNRRTLKSRIHQNCIGYALLVASSVDGYLYQFCAQGEWYNENEKPVATYSFTAPVITVHINDYVIYCVTTESVETHTSRIGHKLFNNRFEYPTISGFFSEESNPDMNAAIAVIGLCSFMHVQYVCVNSDNLVLISNSSLVPNTNLQPIDPTSVIKRRSGGSGGCEIKRNIAARLLAEAKAKHNLLRGTNLLQQSSVNEWTLYNLEVPKIQYVIEDLETTAESFRAASSSNFYDLMEESHVMLRLSICLLCEKLSPESEQHLRAKFIDNCRKLADFSIRSKKKEVYLQATGFYKMCNAQLIEIYANHIANFLKYEYDEKDKSIHRGGYSTNNPDELVGLIYTVKHFLVNVGTDRLKAAFVNQLVNPFFTPKRVVEKGFQHVPLSLEFLNMFIKYSPVDIPQIMLSSPVMADAIGGELINYLKYLEKLNPEENLLLAVTSCRMSNYILSQEVISKTSRRDLAVSLIKYKNVLFDDGTVLFEKERSEIKMMCDANYQSAPQKQSQQHRQHKRKSLLGHTCTATHSPQIQPTAIVSFSDFTETILLTTENADLIEAISDAFVHALCIEHSVSLDMLLQLFLNYIASHIGHKGYQTSQKVFVNILQVCYYDFFDVNPLSNLNLHSNTPPQEGDEYDENSSKTPSLNSERDVSIGNSIAESLSGGSLSLEERCVPSRKNRVVYDHLNEQQSPFKSNPSLINHGDQQQFTTIDGETNLKGLKILFRMYMGRLKALSDLVSNLQSADQEQESTNEDFLKLRVECIQFMMRHLQEMRLQQQHKSYGHERTGYNSMQHYYFKSSVEAPTNIGEKKLVFVPFIPDYRLSNEEYEQHINTYIRPIPCLQERPQYLNRLPPYKRCDFSFPNKDEGECTVKFLGWHNELLTLTLKIQSLLASPKIGREIIEEFVAFIQKTSTLIGIDSFLTIILPKNLAINYMLNFCPEYMWQYGKSNGFTPKHWESLLRIIVNKQDLFPNWKGHLAEILNNLVAELTFEELLQCFPSEVIQNRSTEIYIKETAVNCIFDEDNFNSDIHKLSRDHLAMDNVDESNVFELTLRKAVAKQRSIALRSMIESTGTQLFDATNNPMYNL